MFFSGTETVVHTFSQYKLFPRSNLPQLYAIPKTRNIPQMNGYSSLKTVIIWVKLKRKTSKYCVKKYANISVKNPGYLVENINNYIYYNLYVYLYYVFYPQYII